MKVLVTDGECRSALAVTRSLGKYGHAVYVAGIGQANITASSKYCYKAFTTPDPLVDSASYCYEIANIVELEKIDVIFPMTEQSIYSLNHARAKFGESVVLACAPAEKMEAVSNKYKLIKLAEKLEVPIPSTLYVDGVDDFFQKRVDISSFPVVVKPSFSKIESDGRILSAGVMYAADQYELSRLYETTPVLLYPSMIQERLGGEGTGLFTLFDHNRHLALFSHRRLLEKPPSGGVSVLSESVSLDDEMIESAGKLLSAVDWTGIAMVEFKRDIRDGRAKLMEINGRFWGSLQLAVSSGIDFPALCLAYYLGNKPASVMFDYQVGQRLKWVFGILDHLIIRLKRGNALQNLSPETLSCWQVAMELLTYGDAYTSYDVYDAEDTKPFFSESMAYMNNILRLKR